MTERVLDWTPEDAMREWARVNPGCDAHPRGSGAYPPSLYALDFARAVEAAVLAKCVKFTDGSYAHFRDGKPVVSEVEARERERRAFVCGWHNIAERDVSGLTGRTLERSVDKAYPSLKPVEPPPLVLSTGTWQKIASASGWMCGGRPNIVGTPWCAIAADARALAEWLEKWGDK